MLDSHVWFKPGMFHWYDSHLVPEGMRNPILNIGLIQELILGLILVRALSHHGMCPIYLSRS